MRLRPVKALGEIIPEGGFLFLSLREALATKQSIIQRYWIAASDFVLLAMTNIVP